MSYITGTASSAVDYWTKLLAFLTTNADLVAGNEQWTKVWQHPGGEQTGVVVRGPGLANQESIYIGLVLHLDPDSDEYWIELYGMTAVITTATTMFGHANVSPEKVRMFLDSAPMTYWFVANGRRFVAVAKISTVFQACYGGLFLPYSTPLRYRLPLMIGGCAGQEWGQSSPDSWRSVYSNHSMFPFSHLLSFQQQTPSLYILSPSAEWLTCWGTKYSSDRADVCVHPNAYMDDELYGYLPAWQNTNLYGSGLDSVLAHAKMAPAKDGTLTLTHMHLVRRTAQEEIYGVFDGCMRVVGVNNSSENIVTIGEDEDARDFLVVQNTYRTAIGDYWALELG